MTESKKIRRVGKVALIAISRKVLKLTGLEVGSSVIITAYSGGIMIAKDRSEQNGK